MNQRRLTNGRSIQLLSYWNLSPFDYLQYSSNGLSGRIAVVLRIDGEELEDEVLSPWDLGDDVAKGATSI